MSDSIALEAWGAMTAATKVNKVKATPCTHHVQVEWKKGKYRWKACGGMYSTTLQPCLKMARNQQILGR